MMQLKVYEKWIQLNYEEVREWINDEQNYAMHERLWRITNELDSLRE